MTTRITVETHAWPAVVTLKTAEEDPVVETSQTVPPQGFEIFHLPHGTTMSIEELPPPAVEIPPPIEVVGIAQKAPKSSTPMRED